MLIGTQKQQQGWKAQTYPVPAPTRTAVRWKASALRTLHRWHGSSVSGHAATIMVPALHNFMPAETVALGWLNEIDALVNIRHRMAEAASITGWDVFTFHTQHNADHFFDTTISTVRDTWVKEGNLSINAVKETKRRFGKAYEYHRVEARMVENLIFQSSLMDWVGNHKGSDVPLRFHVIGTALLSALVSTGSVSLHAAVESATKFGSRWNEALRHSTAATSDDAAGWRMFAQVRDLIEGRQKFSMSVLPEDLPAPDAPSRPFWYSPTAAAEPALITTAQEAANALETLNLASWSTAGVTAHQNADEPVRGWLVSPLHPAARLCRWSVSNYLLATPDSVSLF